MNLYIFSDRQILHVINSLTCSQLVKDLLVNSVIGQTGGTICEYFYNVLVEYHSGYLDASYADLNHRDRSSTFSWFNRLQDKLQFSRGKVCLVEPAELLHQMYTYEAADPDLYDDVANLLYIQGGSDNYDLVDQTIGAIKSVVCTIESHYVYTIEKIDPLKVIVACSDKKLFVAFNPS